MTAYLITPDDTIAVYSNAQECQARAGRIIREKKDLMALPLWRVKSVLQKARDKCMVCFKREGGGYFMDRSKRYNEIAARIPKDIPVTDKRGCAEWLWRLMEEGARQS